MDRLINVLTSMSKVTAREFTARIKFENIEALTLLREQEELAMRPR